MWLLDSDTRDRIERAQLSGVVPDAQAQAEYFARHDLDMASGSPRILSIAGNNAEIDVRGVLTNTPDFIAMIFGGGNTTYPEIIASLAAAQADEAVDNITLHIDSPGGSINGLFDTLLALQNTSKPIRAVVSNMAASAAYAIASKAGEIVAANRATRFGSIGVVARFLVPDDEVEITSSKAPKKAPDVTTPEGVKMVQEELDALHNLFVDEVAQGRGTTPAKVNANFGKGATVLADEAQRRNMIDAIAAPKFRVIEPSNVEDETETPDATVRGEMEASDMTLSDLQREHPEVFTEAKNLGATEERDRVLGHLTLGEASGATEIAATAIKEGTEFGPAIQAQYMAAGMNRDDIATRADDETTTAAAADDTGAASESAETEAEAVASLVESLVGVDAPTEA